VTARLDSLISSYLGTTAKNIRTLFEYAQRMPCVLFLDEFDAIAKARDDSNELGELKRVVNSLLQNVDAMSNDSLLIAATNHEQLLDPAVWRRFDSRIEIEKPDIEAEIKLIDLFSDKAGSFTDKEKYEMALAFQGFSGAEIETIIVNAIRTSVIEDVPFDIKSVFHQYFLFRNIAPQDIHDQKEETEAEARYLRAINSKVFSIQVIADILGCSKSSIQRILKEKKDE
jgi:SpoVK/Ycf46/Vps4 family AAA+-type ATPase